MYWVYILECNDGTLYTGITTDVDRRLTEHLNGTGAKYTKIRGVKRLCYQEKQPDRSLASKREYEIKQLSREDKLKLIQSVNE